MTYAEKLKDPRWQKKRLEIMQRDNFQCQLCGDTKTTLNVHHKEYINGNNPWDYDSEILVTVCEHCHDEITYLIKQYQGVKFNDFDVYKLNNWTNGSRIMLVHTGDILSVRTYDKKGKFLTGYGFDDEEIEYGIIEWINEYLDKKKEKNNGKEIH